MRILTMTMGGIALGMLLVAASGASATQPVLNWSYSATGVGSCDLHTSTGCSPAHPPVYKSQGFQAGNNLNASSSASYSAYGVSHGSANPGAYRLPELHSDVSGLPSLPGVPYSWDYSQVQGVMGYTAKRATVVDLHDFVGALDYSITGPGTGIVSASLAILSNAVSEKAIGDSWFTQDTTYGFANTCSSPAALALGETGYNFTKGVNLALTVTPTICGASTISVAAGESIYFWTRMQTFEAAFGSTDASNTFKVEFAPGLSEGVIRKLTRDFKPIVNFRSSAPEPATWAMLVLGLGGVGGLFRARRRTFAAG